MGERGQAWTWSHLKSNPVRAGKKGGMNGYSSFCHPTSILLREKLIDVDRIEKVRDPDTARVQVGQVRGSV